MEKRQRGGKYTYLPCTSCGQEVAHAAKTGRPLHSHRWSQKCRDATARRRGPQAAR